MLTYEDILGLAELTEEEVHAIAQHEHLPEMIAAEIGNYLVHSEDGIPAIKSMILDDIEDARRRGDRTAELTYKGVLKHFVETHPVRVGGR